MGCDIHCFVEKKIDGVWTKITGFVSDFYDPSSEYFSSEEDLSSDSPINRRNYTLFSLLADVRSSGRSLKPISPPKGLPEDCCDSIKESSRDWDGDGHSHSYLTVAELLSGIDQEVEMEGVVSFDNYKNYKITGEVKSWCASVGGGVWVSTTADFDNLIRWGMGSKNNYTVMKWKVNIKKYLQHFVESSLPQLIDRCATEDKSDVRIVFWFDN